MRRLRILHSADFHFDREHQEPSLASLRAFLAFGREHGVDLWVLAGDLFNRAVQNTRNSGFPRLVRLLREMMDLAPLVAVRGTPTHDLPGCYEALQEMRGRHGLTLLDSAGRLAFLGADGGLVTAPRGADADGRPEGARLLVLGCPEPSPEGALEADRERAQESLAGRMAELGRVRRRHDDLPCLFVYHGLVRGALLPSGQLTGRGEVAAGRDELAAVGADYYALGHVHLAQRLPGLQAWYPGSAFPVNWGEREVKSFRQVLLGREAGRSSVTVRAVPFPHPPRRKLVLAPGGSIAGDLAGCQVWLEVIAGREEAAAVDRAALLRQLLAAGAEPGSRVTLAILPAEAVRAAQIREAQRLEEKVAVWAEAAGEALTPEARQKVRELEAGALREGKAPVPLHLRVRRLRLRGAVGIRRGQGCDEIELDLDRYAPDLVALVGPNGAGKTTLIENMHPFPEMLTRGGKLQDHFYLRDSCRDLTFSDELSGDEYRALLLIDGRNPTGRVEHLLYRNGVCLTNGRREDYLARVESLFGSLELFLRSVFIPQKPSRAHPDLGEATKGERKALFRELAGLDYLQAHSEAAREKARALEQAAERGEWQAEPLRRAVAALPELAERRAALAEALARSREELAAREEELARLRRLQREMEAAQRRAFERKVRLEGLAARAGALAAERRALREEIGALEAEAAMAAERRPAREEKEEVRCPRCGLVFSPQEAPGPQEALGPQEAHEHPPGPQRPPDAGTGPILARLRARLASLEEGSTAAAPGPGEGPSPAEDGEGERVAALLGALEGGERARDELMRAVTRGERDLLHLEDTLAGLGRQAALLGEVEEGIARSRREAAGWLFVERACGPDGVQALELDAMGPGIAAVANRLLQAAYGTRFQVDFQTVRLGGSGSRRRRIEDFLIRVLDLESGSEQLLETLSGGEAVWVKRAITDAFGIVRDRGTGLRFLTAFQDEADGALDPEARLAFFRMLRAAHLESGRAHTLVITHSEEAQEMIPQRILLGGLSRGCGEKNDEPRPPRIDSRAVDAYS